MAQVGREGYRISNEDYEKHQPFYARLSAFAEAMNSFIEDGYIYEGVRICRVEPQAPPSSCLQQVDPRAQGN